MSNNQKRFVLGIDQGTTGTTGLLLDLETGVAAFTSYAAHKQIYPQPGWVEHDPFDILECVRRVLKDCCRFVSEMNNTNGDGSARLVAIGVANQGETIMAWEKSSGQPVYNAIVWQDEARTRGMVEEIRKAHPTLDDHVRRVTGLRLDSYFSASKVLSRLPLANKNNHSYTVFYSVFQ